jgi:hypothetical protein
MKKIIKNPLWRIIVVMLLSSPLYAVNPEAFATFLSENRTQAAVRKAFSRQAQEQIRIEVEKKEQEAHVARAFFLWDAWEHIRKEVEKAKTEVLIRMELTINSRGFFRVETILEDPTFCKELVERGLGSKLYNQITRDRVLDISEAADTSKDALTKIQYKDGEAEAHWNCFPTPFSESLMSKTINQFIEQEIGKAEESLGKDMEPMIAGRSFLDVRCALRNVTFCKEVMRRGLPKAVGDVLLDAAEPVEKDRRSCSTQTDYDSFVPKTEGEKLEKCLQESHFESRLKMSALKTSFLLALLDMKKTITDPEICREIVVSGLGWEGSDRLKALASARKSEWEILV